MDNWTLSLGTASSARIVPSTGFLDPPEFLDTLRVHGPWDNPPTATVRCAAEWLVSAFRAWLSQGRLSARSVIEVRCGRSGQVEWRWREPEGTWTALGARPSARLAMVKMLHHAIVAIDDEIDATYRLGELDRQQAYACALEAAEKVLWDSGGMAAWSCLASVVTDLVPLSPLQRVSLPLAARGSVRKLPVRLDAGDIWRIAQHSSGLVQLSRESPSLVPLAVTALRAGGSDVTAGGLRAAFQAAGGSRLEWKLACRWDEVASLRSLARHGMFSAPTDMHRVVRVMRLLVHGQATDHAFSRARAAAALQLAAALSDRFPLITQLAVQQVLDGPSPRLRKVAVEASLIERYALALGSSAFVRESRNWRSLVSKVRERYLHETQEWWTPFASARRGTLRAKALTSREALESEAREMQHCADTYAQDCIEATYLVFSIRDLCAGGQRATLGLRWNRKASRWLVHQVSGAENADVSVDVHRFAEQIATRAGALRSPLPMCGNQSARSP